MIAHHPTTGAPIRILRTETQIAYDWKTLVWLRSTHAPSHRWKRWMPVISELDAVSVCGASAVAAVLVPSNADIGLWFPVVSNIYSVSPQCLFLMTERVDTALSKLGFANDRTLLWEELYEGYPYLGGRCSAKSSFETILISLAHILRIQRIVWSSTSLDAGAEKQMAAWKSSCDGTVTHITRESDDSCIPRLWLIQQYFQHPSLRRQKEVSYCLEKNIACDSIDSIILINEQDYPELPTSSKITLLRTDHRLTYKAVFQTIRTHVPAGDYVMFANADIYCNDSINAIWSLNWIDRAMCFALSRWEEDATKITARSDSQDAWIVARDSIMTNTIDEYDFPFGKAGCNSAFALLMMKQKFLVVNPAHTIRTFHVHSSNIRNYDPKDLLYRPMYLYVEPTSIQMLGVVKDMKSYEIHNDVFSGLNTSFQRPILSVDESAASAVCSRLSFDIHSGNLYTPTQKRPTPYHITGGAFATCDGLIYTHKGMCIGGNIQWQHAWENTQVSSLTNAIHIPHFVVIPFSMDHTLENWVLYYLPRVLAVRNFAKQRGEAEPEFLVPHSDGIGSLLSDFEWKDSSSITVNPMSENLQYYSEDMWCIPPGPQTLITHEDIALLRTLLPATPPTNTVPVAVLCVSDSEDALCSRGWADNVAQYILSTWKIRIISPSDAPAVRRKAFMEATWIIGTGSALDWIWYAQPTTMIMEFVSDGSNNHIHLAGAAGLRYCMGVVKDELLAVQRQNAMTDIGKAIHKFGFKDTLTAMRNHKVKRVPSIIVPSGFKGFLGHDGHGFREMITLWAERKYVNVEYSTLTPYCWWGSVGEVLLYDRPTLRWWRDDLSYQMALFANCAPPGPRERQSLWGYWGFSPRLLQTLTERSKHLRRFIDRPIQSIFFGRIRNGTHAALRKTQDWSSCIERFSLEYDTTDSAYSMTHDVYLETLCSSRFGLCLPGTGQHSYRLIEYLACGCVPILTPGISADTFLAPLKEGLHFLRAKTPDDVRRIVKETSADEWTMLSKNGRAWWSTYASAEGLFRLTWARIEQCRPYLDVGIPGLFLN